MARETTLVSFGSRQYQVVVNTTYGVAYILRVADQANTHLMTCSDGYEDYCTLKRAWRRDRQAFHRLCEAQTYYPPEVWKEN